MNRNGSLVRTYYHVSDCDTGGTHRTAFATRADAQEWIDTQHRKAEEWNAKQPYHKFNRKVYTGRNITYTNEKGQRVTERERYGKSYTNDKGQKVTTIQPDGVGRITFKRNYCIDTYRY